MTTMITTTTIVPVLLESSALAAVTAVVMAVSVPVAATVSTVPSGSSGAGVSSAAVGGLVVILIVGAGCSGSAASLGRNLDPVDLADLASLDGREVNVARRSWRREGDVEMVLCGRGQRTALELDRVAGEGGGPAILGDRRDTGDTCRESGT